MSMSNSLSGTLYIVAAPSGGGKNQLVQHLVKNLPDIQVSISHTTRDQRPGEQEGVNYFYVSESDFIKMVKNHEFIEHAKVFEHYYGTSVVQINQRLALGIDVVLDIDWQGARQIKTLFADAVSIFIVPPSLVVLRERLQARQRDDSTVIAKRMEQAQAELSHYKEFDFLIVNDEFSKAATELSAIILAQRLKLSRQLEKQKQLLSFLLTSS